MARGLYTVHGDAQAVSTAITILEVTAPSTAVLEIKRACVEQSSVTTSAQARIRLLRKTGTITGTASPPSAIPIDAAASSGVTIKWIATAEGTDGNVIYEENFNILNGWLWVPASAMERIIVPPSGLIALKFPAAPTSANWTFGFVWVEIG